jgi:hypothetical protein
MPGLLMSTGFWSLDHGRTRHEVWISGPGDKFSRGQRILLPALNQVLNRNETTIIRGVERPAAKISNMCVCVP